MKLFEELNWRGFIKDVSDIELATKLLNEEKINFYCGFDPTADSLTIGHLVQIIRILLLQKYGHRPIVLVGGATGLIGDPGGRNSERKLLTLEKSLENAEVIKQQLSKYIDFNDDNGAIMVNNYDWISKINVIEFLRDYGKNFTINYMLAKDSVNSRLESGISYTEFSYMLIQAIDFMHLYKNYNCRLQFGGSDQWGNITTGLELIRKTISDNEKVIGISSYLLTKADGSKFGKSESGALWLDPKVTPSYAIYQYFINSSDADVIRYMKNLTLLDPELIMDLEQKVISEPHLREAQKVLAKEIVTFMHGKEAYEKVVKISDALFDGNIKELSIDELEQALNDVPTTNLDNDINIIDLLVLSGVASSKREAREFIENNAISINDEKVSDVNYMIATENALNNKYTVIRRGKKNYYLIKHI